MSWRVVYIEESEQLNLYLDNIKIQKDSQEILIPLSDIHTIILDNYKTTLSVHLINALTKNNINTVLCDINHLPQSIITPHSGNTLATLMLKKQLGWSENEIHIVHEIIIRNKIKNQCEMLIHFNCDNTAIERLREYYDQVGPGDLTNKEGHAAKVYFRAMYTSSFKRFNEDVVNAGLNYGYAIIRSQISKILIGKGLNTNLGFFHRNRANKFNLSDDFIEPFRPIIDRWVKNNLMETEIFLKEHRISLIKETTKTMIYDNKRQTIFNVMHMYVESIINFLETGEVDKILEVNLANSV